MAIKMRMPVRVTGVTLDKSSINLTTVWQTEQLTATITPANAEDTAVTWSSSDTTVATVSTTWLVTCVTPWEATITVTTHDGGYTATCGVSASRLPSAYQEVEYIQSSGTQYIDTTHQHTANSKVEIKFNYQSMSTEWNLLFGSRQNSSSNTAFDIFVHYSSYIGYTCWDNDVTNFYSSSTDTDYTISLSKNNVTINWNSTTISTNLTSYGYNDWLFNFNEWWQPIWWCYPVKAKLFYCKIRESDTLVRDFVPCYRIADSVIWMYDLVNDVFYTNQWSGTFTKWADV